MGRKRKDEDQLPEHDEPKPEPEHRSRRGRKLALLVALAGAAAYVVRRNQRKAEIDEGIWHEAPAPSPATPASTSPRSRAGVQPRVRQPGLPALLGGPPLLVAGP